MAVDQNENRVRDNVRRAIELMTARTVDPDKQFTWSRFVQNVTEEPDGAVQMLIYLRGAATPVQSELRTTLDQPR
jgi:hypothetical protein